LSFQHLGVIRRLRRAGRSWGSIWAGRIYLIAGVTNAMSFVVQVASYPDRDELVAEIWWNDRMVAEVRRGSGDIRYIDLYPSPSRIPWSFKLEEWLAVVKKAESQLK
jgi:hypothetical protein